MREVPLSIQRAMIRRNAVVSSLSVFALVALAGYMPFPLFVSVSFYMAIIYIHVLSATAQKFKALKNTKRIGSTYASSVERFMENILIIGLPLFVVIVLVNHWVFNAFSAPMATVLYIGLISMASLAALYFYVMQLSQVIANRHVQSIFN